MALERKNLNNKKDKDDNQVNKDYQNTNDSSFVNKAIAIAAISIGGFAAYKSGLLKEPVKAIRTVVDEMANRIGDDFSSGLKTIRKWANKKTAYQLGDLTNILPSDAYTIRNHSLLRKGKESSFIYDLFKDLKTSKMDKTLNLSRIKTSINDTTEDIRDLYGMLRQAKTKKPVRRHSMYHTELGVTLREMNKGLRVINEEGQEATLALSGLYRKHFEERMTLSSKKATQQLRESGSRNLVLGDILEFDTNTGRLVQKEKTVLGNKEIDLRKKIKFNIEDEKNPGTFLTKEIDSYKIDLGFYTNPKEKSVLTELNEYITNPYVAKAGQKSNIPEGWKDIIVDRHIFITEDGLIQDTRLARQGVLDLANSLSSDFGLPFVKFNPLNTVFKMTGADAKIKNRVPVISAVIGPEAIEPAITGSSKITTGQWLENTFGIKNVIGESTQPKTNNIYLIGKNAYIKNPENPFEMLQVGDRLKTFNISGRRNPNGIPAQVDAIRRMGQMNTDVGIQGLPWEVYSKKYLPPEQRTAFNRFRYKFGQLFDIGHEELRMPKKMAEEALFTEAERLDDFASADEFVNKGIRKFTKKVFKTYGFGQTEEEIYKAYNKMPLSHVFGKAGENNKYGQTNYAMIREAYTFRDVFKSKSSTELKENLKGLVFQYFDGFDINGNMGKYFTTRTAQAWSIPNALNQGLESIGLGLSNRSMRSNASAWGNLLIKRALPVFMLTQIPGMINYFSEPFFAKSDKTKEDPDNPDNLGKAIIRNIIKPMDIKFHRFMDLTGATKFFKNLQEFVPGSDQLNELPGIYQLGLGQTQEEREKYIENGYDPVRKARFWSAGNTPFTGGKIEYWRPNFYRRVEADVKFSDSMYGSRQEYYNNTWYPNLVNPLAPINYLANPDHWDKKHYHDRPYLKSAPVGQNLPVVGPLVGAITTPFSTHKMHKEYWEGNQPKNINPEDEKLNLKQGVVDQKILQQSIIDLNNLNQINTNQTFKNQIYQDNLSKTKDIAKKLLFRRRIDLTGANYTPITFGNFEDKYNIQKEVPIQETNKAAFVNNNINPLQTGILPVRPYDRHDTGLEAYITPSGNVNVVDVPNELNLYKVNNELKHYSINKIYGTNQRVDINSEDLAGKAHADINDKNKITNRLFYNLGEEYNQLGDIAGLRGFIFQSALGGEANERVEVIDTSEYAYSFNRQFWGQSLGGFGGELSEIARRFIPKRNTHAKYINPIRNTMPSWMPGSNYFIDFKHGDPYTKVQVGEERLPGEGYERLNKINLNKEFRVNTSELGLDQDTLVNKMLHQDIYHTYDEKQKQKEDKALLKPFNDELKQDTEDYFNAHKRTAKFRDKLRNTIKHGLFSQGQATHINGEVNDNINNIHGTYDAMVKDITSRTGQAVLNIRPVSSQEFNELKSGKQDKQNEWEMNYLLWATNNSKGKGYIRYINEENPEEEYLKKIKFNKKMLQETIQNVQGSRQQIMTGLQTGQIGRGELYPLMDRFRVLADVAPYSQEFKDISNQISNAKLTQEQQEEAKDIRERIKKQKEPLRVYDYKFSTANLKKEQVTVREVIDNNTIITEEYGTAHAIKFAGINVSESNSELYSPRYVKRKGKTGREYTQAIGISKNEAAANIINKDLRPGQKITISYDNDEANKYSKDSTNSIRAIISTGRYKNLNRVLLGKGLAKEKETDDSAAGIHARYSEGEIAFGSAMENLTHKVVSNIPFIGNKFMQVNSPYEQYRKREVYGKDFQSWNHPIRDILIPNIESNIARDNIGMIGSVATGAFIGSLFGRQAFGRGTGALIGGGIAFGGRLIHNLNSTKEREWRPKRRIKQEELNEYIDTLKYVKDIRLYNQYKEKALKENNFDVEAYLKEKEEQGEKNKERQRELTNFKKRVKLNYGKHKNFDFETGAPKYVNMDSDKKQIIHDINKEIAELQNERKVEKLPLNAIKAISYKQASERTMYGFDPGESLANIMSALPKKERQYYKHFMNAPEEEKEKILRIAPSYLRRALQSTWKMKVDKKPELDEYFTKHALPDEDWIGWDENTDMDSVKVKLVHQEKLDPGEFDIWDDNKEAANQVNIPIPKMDVENNPLFVKDRLQKLLSKNGYNDVKIDYSNHYGNNHINMNVKKDGREDTEKQINNLRI